jgi:steroid delta-isomerase-like uncharacterized protein
MSEQNTELMKRWFQEVWNEGRMQTVYDLFAPDGIATGQAGPTTQLRGPAEFVGFVERLRGAFPDIKLTVEDLIASGDRVALRWSATMTHTGNTLGPASGKPVRSTGITIARFEDGKIVEGWDSWDQLGMLEQIGAYQAPSAMMPLAKIA